MYTKRVFVSIPEGDMFRRIYAEAIKPLTTSPFEVVCYYDHPNTGDFSQSISTSIGFSNVVICILSGTNPNVLYEVGLAIGYGKPIIPITDSIESIPAMLRGRVAILYDRFRPDTAKLKEELQAKFEQILHGDYMPLRMRTHTELLRHKNSDSTRRSSEAPVHKEPLAQAIHLYQEQKYLAAIKILNELLADHPNERVYFYLSDCHFLYSESLPEGMEQHKHQEKFLEISELGHHHFPNHRDLFKNVGLAYLKLNRLDEAQATLSKLLRKNHRFDVARYNMACVHSKKGDLFACLKELSTAMENEPAFRNLARVDPDFDPMWRYDLFQRLLFPMPQID